MDSIPLVKDVGCDVNTGWHHISDYYYRLLDDIYIQPPDPVHTKLAAEVIEHWFTECRDNLSVLDVGCGQGFCAPFFELRGFQYTGVTMGDDYEVAKWKFRNVYPYDMNFLPYEDESFNFVFSRHSLEHSPFPVLTLMEWYRVSKQWLCLVIPKPSYWQWYGRNHYSMLSDKQATFLLNRAGWHVVDTDHSDEMEYRYLCEKAIGPVDDINPHVPELDKIALNAVCGLIEKGEDEDCCNCSD